MCAQWQQPVDPAAPQGEAISLQVAKLPSTALEPARDAMVFVNGGPGGSSIDLVVTYAQIAQSFTRERDVIVIDQRGTGRSAPLTCPGLTDTTEELSPEDTLAVTRQCLDALPHDPRFFTTSVAVDELEALRQALGYEQLSLYGVSYGTRVVQQYMRRYPAATRAAIIDGVVPPPRALGNRIAIHSQMALDAAILRCNQTAACQQQFPALADDLATLSEMLHNQTIDLTLQHPVTGLPTDMPLAYPHLMMWLRFSLYAPETTALIPFTVHQAAQRNIYLPIAANALRMMNNITTSLNYGMHNAVMCTEDAPFYSDSDADFAAMDATYIGRQMYDILKSMCSVWPAGVLHADMKDPLQSDVPTLVLSGEFDPITPPAWGDEVMPGLSRAIHVVAPGQGHGVLPRGCVPKLALDFIETPDPAQLDSSCVKHLAPTPFFINTMGPPP